MIGLYQSHFLSPFGWLTLGANMRGLCAVRFGKHGAEYGSSEFLDLAALELAEYFQKKREIFTVPTHVEATLFLKDVWQCLSEIPYGATPTYGDIAAKIGRPKAVRAVGMAVNKNPLLIILPCHRVIGKNGDLTGYAGGLSKKIALLRFEMSTVKPPPRNKTS